MIELLNKLKAQLKDVPDSKYLVAVISIAIISILVVAYFFQ